MNIRLVLVFTVFTSLSMFALIYRRNRERAKVDSKYASLKARKIESRYSRYRSNPITRGAFSRITLYLDTINCYSDRMAREVSVKTFEKNIAIAAVFPIVAAALSPTVFSITSGLVASVAYYIVAVDNRIEIAKEEYLKELSLFVQSIRDNFMETNSVVEAVGRATASDNLQGLKQTIAHLAVESEDNIELDRFCSVEVFRQVKTLAMTCNIVNAKGDTIHEGRSSFIEQLNTLRQEIDNSVLYALKTRVTFKTYIKLIFVSVPVGPLMDMYLIKAIPGTSVVIKGVLGMFISIFIMVVTMICLSTISGMTKTTVASERDVNDKLLVLFKRRHFRKLIDRVEPSNRAKQDKLRNLLEGAVSTKTVDYVYGTKIVYSLVFFLLTVVLLTAGTYTAKAYMYNATHTLSFVDNNIGMTVEDYERIERLDKKVVAKPELPSKDVLYNLYDAQLSSAAPIQVDDQVNRITRKYEVYHGLKFRWYYLVIAYIFGVVGWFMPESILLNRKRLVLFEANEDILQLQSMMMILANTNMDVQECLYWLEKQSSSHKHVILRAAHNFAGNATNALEELYNATPSAEFRRLISKLKISTYNVAISDAFSDIIADKEQSSKMANVIRDNQLEGKKVVGSLMGLVPLFMLVLLKFMLPILVVGVTELSGSIGGLVG